MATTPKAQSGDAWTRVRDKKPSIVEHWGGSDNKMYGQSAPLLVFNGTIRAGVYYKSGTWASQDGDRLEKVTHWQNLPAPPLRRVTR